MAKYNNFFKSKAWTFEADPGFPLRVKLEDPQEETHLHQHEFCECVFIVRGHGRHQSEDHPPVTVRRGCVIVIPVRGHHAYSAVSPDFAVFNLLFDTSQLPSVLLELYSHPSYKHIFLRSHSAYGEQDFPLMVLEDGVFRKLETMLTDLAETDGTTGNHCYKLGLFMVVLSRLCAEWKIRSDSLAVPLNIPKLTAYLEQNFRKEVYLDDLAKLAGMSRSTLLRHFRAALGVTPMVYLRNLRLRHAAELLLGTDFGLKEIADQSGFFWMPYFFQSFRARYGVSPLEYRRESSSGNPPGNP